jgi:hypothetical protein
VMMIMMVFRTQGLLPFRRPRFRESDLARAEAALVARARSEAGATEASTVKAGVAP